MTDTPDPQRPRSRPRPGPRPTPRPRVAGSRRDRDEEAGARTARPAPSATPRPAARKAAVVEKPAVEKSATPKPRATARPARSSTRSSATTAKAAAPRRRRLSVLALVLALLCVAAAAGVGLLLWQRLNPGSVNASIFAAARDGVQALYAYDYRDSEGSIERKLAVLTGDLRQQYEEDLEQGGIVDAYEQVSATTRYEVLDVGLQQVNDAQDTATVVVFGQYVVESVNSGEQEAPEGSECQVTPEGAQSCTQTLKVRMLQVDGDWRISELTVRTTS
jgi:hypothetical protein